MNWPGSPGSLFGSINAIYRPAAYPHVSPPSLLIGARLGAIPGALPDVQHQNFIAQLDRLRLAVQARVFFLPDFQVFPWSSQPKITPS